MFAKLSYSIAVLAVPLVTLLSGCVESGGAPPEDTSVPSVSVQQPAALPPPTEAIPPDVEYQIIDSTTLSGIKRSLDVRLNKKVSEEVLEAIAWELKSRDSGTYERTFIVYYLPGMQVNAGGWATTHFNPELAVRILGLPAAAEEELKAEPEAEDREILGRWIDDAPYVGSRIVIYRKDGSLFMERTYKDGSGGVDEVVARQTSRGTRYDPAEGSRFSDHWVVNHQGELELRDDEGLIRTARSLG